MRDHDARQTEREMVDWLAWFVWGALLTTLLLGSVWGHAIVSARIY